MENPIKMDDLYDLGAPPLKGHTHVFSASYMRPHHSTYNYLEDHPS